MAVIAVLYLALSLALASAWIATELRLQPRPALAIEFLVAALAWPIVLAFAVVLMLVTKSKKHDG
jgi:uncharacterized membrane protein YbhN (UPF0104 family)